MHYEINVSFNGKHLFATHERSLRDLEPAKRLYKELCLKFPKEEGYLVTLTKYETTGRLILDNK